MSKASNKQISEKPESNENQKTYSEIPKTLGFLTAVAGVFFLIGSIFSLITLTVLKASSGDAESFTYEEVYATVLSITTLLITLMAIFTGFKLIKQLDIGRKLFNVFTVIVIALAWGKYAYQQNEITKSFANMPPELAANAKQLELSSALTVFILPAVLILAVLLLNMRSSRNSLKR